MPKPYSRFHETWSKSMKVEPERTIAPMRLSLRTDAALVVPVYGLPPSMAKPRKVMWSLFSTNRAAEKLLAPVVRACSGLPVPTRVR